MHLEIDVLDKVFHFSHRIKHGTTITPSQTVGQFPTETDKFEAPITLKVVEKDLLFSDKGSSDYTINFDTTTGKPQSFTFEVKVKEAWKFWFRRATAVFVIILEVEPVSKGVVPVTKTRPRPYGAVFKGKDLNRFDAEIADEVYYWNNEFAGQQYPPTVLLDPGLVKAMMYVESTMGYGIDPTDPDIMQVANPNDPALHTLNSDGWRYPTTGKVAQENEWINGEVQALNHHNEAKVITTRDSIHWGVRWLYHKAQSIEGKGRAWLDWKKAVERYGPLPKKSDKKSYYADKVWDIYTKGVDPKGVKIWSVLQLLIVLGALAFGIKARLDYIHYETPIEAGAGGVLSDLPSSNVGAAGEVLSDSVYAKEWELPSYQEARKITTNNAVPFNLLHTVQRMATTVYPTTNCRAGASERDTEERLKNCTYTVGTGESDMWTAKFKNGGYGFNPGQERNYGDYYNVGPYGVGLEQSVQGDVNQDGRTDAVVLFRVSYEGSHDLFNLVVLTGQPDTSFKQVANYAIEAAANIEDVLIDHGVITVHAYLHGDADAECCPTKYQTLRFKITD